MHQKDTLKNTLFTILSSYRSIKIIAGVIHFPSIYHSLDIKTPEQVHTLTYKTLLTSFQQRLKELTESNGLKVNGIVISDHRNPFQDSALRNFHMDLLKSDTTESPTYPNLIESLFLTPSHHSIGIQLADLVSGAIFRYFEHNDDRWYKLIEENFWKPPIKIDSDWKEKDAESIKLLAQPNLR